jgi:hypothetical protein
LVYYCHKQSKREQAERDAKWWQRVEDAGRSRRAEQWTR